jgi:hypothetical protein
MRSGDIAPVRSLLDALVEAEKLDQDEREEEVDRLLALARALPRAGIVEAVTRAAAGSKHRRNAGIDVLCQHADAPEVQATFVEWLRVPDATARFALIQTIGLRRLAGLAAELGRVIEGDPDELCRDMALWAAGQLRAPECLPVVLRLAAATRHQRPGTARLGATNPDWRLLQVLTAYGAPEGRPFLEVAFSDVVRKPGDRVQAAWGLAKLGDAAAFSYLREMLDDPDVRTSHSFTPGQSWRAAQAIADVRGWPLGVGRAGVEEVKRRLRADAEP